MFDGQLEPHLAPRISEIQRVVAQRNGITVDDIKAPCRKREFAIPRQMAAYLARDMTPRSYPEIGRHFGGRDHTTILFAYRKMKQLEATDARYTKVLGEYRAQILEIVRARTPVSPPTLSEEVAEANALLCAGDSSEWHPQPRVAPEADQTAWLNLGGELEAA